MSDKYGVWIQLRYDHNEDRTDWKIEDHRAPALPIPHLGQRIVLHDNSEREVDEVAYQYPQWGAMEPTLMVWVDLGPAR